MSNDSCHKCGHPYGRRRRCYKCTPPYSVRGKPGPNGIYEDPPPPVIPVGSAAWLLRASAAPPAEDRAELIRRACARKAEKERSAVKAERNGDAPRLDILAESVCPSLEAQVREAIAREPFGPPIVVPDAPPTFIPADPEIAAIAAAHAALSGLPEPATRRALEYLGYRLLSRFPGNTH